MHANVHGLWACGVVRHVSDRSPVAHLMVIGPAEVVQPAFDLPEVVDCECHGSGFVGLPTTRVGQCIVCNQ